jgi:hypothetical protein
MSDTGCDSRSPERALSASRTPGGQDLQSLEVMGEVVEQKGDRTLDLRIASALQSAAAGFKLARRSVGEHTQEERGASNREAARVARGKGTT